ncbi:MAG TPA: type II secretion system F family protein [Caulobacteraceae bacterium]|jgi:tight adherence protein B
MPQLPELNASHVILVLVFAAAFMAAQTVAGLIGRGRVKRVVNRRLTVAEQGGKTLGELVVELRKQRGLQDNGGRSRRLAWLSDLIIRSGVVYRPRKWAAMFGGAGFAVAALLFMFTRNWWLSPLAGLGLAAFVPLTWLKMKAKKRAKQLGQQLPDALEIIVRSLEAGHPVPTAVALVGREMPDPIGSEFGMAADEISFGATLEQAIGNIADRCRHPDIDLVAATIRLQERSGGNLTGLLKTNAATVRARFKMRLKIQAASSEGRASAMILNAVPFVVMAIVTLVNPHFYGDVIHARPIQIGLACFGVWMAIGNVIIRKMIDLRI